MGEKSDAVLMHSIDGKSFQGLSEVSELTMDVTDKSELFPINALQGGEMTFSCDINPLALIGIIMDKTTLAAYAKLINNGWRRRHGLPMIRQATLRRLRRNKDYDEP